MNINQRDKNVLLVGFMFTACYLLFFFIIEPIYKKQIKTNDIIKNKIQFIQKYYEVLNQKTYYQENRITFTTLTGRFFKEKQTGLAAASLQKLIESFSKETISIERSKVEKPKYIDGILAIPIEISIRSNLKNLSLFLMRIESNKKFLIIEKLQSRRINKVDPEEIQTRLIITGFIQQLETQGGKTL